mmetsp:Transcript_40645/g.61956  ORF Transcript_40645/g.61956 Transcript_40645/m.61956 type:complete len:373 (-) Transcript_40645:331-1449(-)
MLDLVDLVLFQRLLQPRVLVGSQLLSSVCLYCLAQFGARGGFRSVISLVGDLRSRMLLVLSLSVMRTPVRMRFSLESRLGEVGLTMVRLALAMGRLLMMRLNILRFAVVLLRVVRLRVSALSCRMLVWLMVMVRHLWLGVLRAMNYFTLEPMPFLRDDFDLLRVFTLRSLLFWRTLEALFRWRVWELVRIFKLLARSPLLSGFHGVAVVYLALALFFLRLCAKMILVSILLEIGRNFSGARFYFHIYDFALSITLSSFSPSLHFQALLVSRLVTCWRKVDPWHLFVRIVEVGVILLNMVGISPLLLFVWLELSWVLDRRPLMEVIKVGLAIRVVHFLGLGEILRETLLRDAAAGINLLVGVRIHVLVWGLLL